MPTYEYACTSCEEPFEKFLPMAESDSAQVCPLCSAPAKRLVSLTGFILKGDDWASKNLRVKRQMEQKNNRLARKTRDHVAPILPPLVPNVGGEQVGSWSEAQKLAQSQGKDVSSYEPLVTKEKSKP